MKIFDGLLPLLAVLLLNCMALCVDASALLDPTAPYTILRAARQIFNVLPRSIESIALAHTAELIYVHDNTNSHELAFTSRITIHSLAPILVLEDLDSQLDEVSCTDGNIKIHFRNADDFEAAKLHLYSLIGGRIITSHSGRIDEGARAPFLIDSLAFSYHDAYITFHATEASWGESFDRIDIDFSHTDQSHELLKHSHLHRTVAATKPTKVPEHDTEGPKPTDSSDSYRESGNIFITPTSSEHASSASHFVIPDVSIIPTSTDLPDSITIDLNKENWQEELSLKAAAEEVIPWASHSPVDITVECVDCHTKGSLVLSQGNWSFPTLKSLQNNNTKLINSGSNHIELQVFSAHIELRLTPTLSGSLSYELFAIPIPAAGFAIPGLGRAGLLFKPELYLDWTTSANLSLTFGFDVTLPAPARLHVDFGDASRCAAGAYVDVPGLAVDARMVPAAGVSAATYAAAEGRAADAAFVDAFPELLAVGAEVGVAAGVDVVVVVVPPMPWVEPYVARWSPEVVGAVEALAPRCLVYANASVWFVHAAAVEVEVVREGKEKQREKKKKHRSRASSSSPSPFVLVTAAVGGLVVVGVVFCFL
ncbi:gpi anchored protein [Neofusicoccum parvum]|uniref:Gpi anchored protein n=1 Tax=Neofusicoccum parvum TaxID=310453 RepID=A0ACB5SCX2_9PEZI|nr:gpi anchored protein [Neofusicoccum parvum]